jgi:hypothetical protein
MVPETEHHVPNVVKIAEPVPDCDHIYEPNMKGKIGDDPECVRDGSLHDTVCSPHAHIECRRIYQRADRDGYV